MADAKLSSFPVTSSITATDYVPILQEGANKLATAGQLKTYTQTLSYASVVDGTISLSNILVGIAGGCSVPAATTPMRLTLIAEGSGTVVVSGVTYSFVVGNTLDLVWFSSKWNVLSNQGMV